MVLRLAVVIVAIHVGAAVAAAQPPTTDFELQVAPSPDGRVSVRCTRGCSLVVLVHHPEEDVMRWDVHPDFKFQCQRDCSSGRGLGGVAPATTARFVPSPHFDLVVENKFVNTVTTVVRCVRGCKFAAVVGSPKPGDPEAKRVTEVRFPCDEQACASGRIGGWVEPQR
jgi:hypothetical protein